MPAANRLVCLLSGPLAVVGGTSEAGVEGELRELPLLDLEQESANVEASLREGCADTGLSVELQVRYATLDALRSVFTLGARVVHFAGHGHPNFLCFEDARGGAVALSPESLRRLIAAGGVGCRLVVVNSCHSLKAGEAFVAAGVPHVVAVSPTANNDGRVSDRAATAFCRAFYLGVISGHTVRQAFEIGCAAAANVGPFLEEPARTFVLLPEDAPHDELIFADAPAGKLEITTPYPAPSNAPAVPTWYLGRNADLCCVIDSVIRARLTTVSGAFGSGKSALASAAASYIAGRGHFDAVVWVRVSSRATLVDDVFETAMRVVRQTTRPAAHARAELAEGCVRSLLARNESVPCCGEEEPCVHYAITPPASSRGAVTRRTSSLTDDESGNNSGGAVAVALSRIEHSVLREKRVLVVLDDLERVLVATPKYELAVRAEVQRALTGLLATCAKAHFLVTCSKGSGLGRATSVTECVIKLRPLDSLSSARLLLQRAPELARRATNARAGGRSSSKVPPHVIVTRTAASAAVRRLAGNPFALALAANLLNHLFECEDHANAAANAAHAASRPARSRRPLFQFAEGAEPPSPQREARAAARLWPDALEPLERLLHVLERHDPSSAADALKGDPIARLREEINFVIEHGAEYGEAASFVGDDDTVTADDAHADEADGDAYDEALDAAGRTSPTANASPPSSRLDAALALRQPAPLQILTAQHEPRVLLKALVATTCAVWLLRLALDALARPDRAFSLRIDAVFHLLLDIALLALVADNLRILQ